MKNKQELPMIIIEFYICQMPTHLIGNFKKDILHLFSRLSKNENKMISI